MRGRLNKFNIGLLLYWIITFIFCPYLRDLFMLGFVNPLNFVTFFAIFFACNFVICLLFGKIKISFSFDLLLRFFRFFPNNFKIIFNFLKVRFLVFIAFFKDTFKSVYIFIDAIYQNIKLKDYKWRPLFKKTSYFGFFRSYRSKWFK